MSTSPELSRGRQATSMNRIPFPHVAILILGLLFSMASAEAHETPYLSPGIAISWNIGRGVVVSPKLSVGMWNGTRFLNVTVGRS